MDEQMQVGIGARIGDFTRKMKQVSRSVKSLPRKVTTKVTVKVDDFNQKIDKLATRIRSLAVVAGSAFKGGLISVLPALSPIIASLVGGLGGLATSFAAAGTGAVLFASVATSALNDVFTANGDIKKLRKELANTDDLKKRAELNKQIAQAVAGLSKEQQKGLKALQSFSKFWGKFAKQFQEPVMDIFIRSLGQVKSLIKTLEPAFKGAVSAFDTLSKNLSGAIKTKEFKVFADFLNKGVEPAMTSLGKVFGNVMLGIMNLMTAFAPLSVNMQDGLVGLTKKFADWSAGLSKSKAFQNFINYVKTNGPKVMALIGNLTTFLVELGKGMASLGSKISDLVNGFLSFSSTLMKSNPIIGKIVAWMISLGGILLALAPGILLLKTAFGGMASAIFTGLGKAFTFIKPLFTNFSGVAASLGSKILPLLRVAFTALTGPIGIIIGVLSLLIPVFVRLWKENEKFRKGVMTAWAIIKNVFMTTVTFISKIVKTVIGALVKWWKANQDQFMAIAKKVWDKVYSVISTVLTTVWGFIQQIVTKIKGFWDKHGTFIMKVAKKAWEFISTVVATKAKMLWSVIKGALGIIKGVFQTVWPIVSGLVKIAWGIIKTVVKSGIDFISGVIDTAMSLLKGDWKGAWNAIKGIVEDVWGNIKEFFDGLDLKKIGKNMIEGLIKGIKSMGKALVKSAKGVVDDAIGGAKKLLGIASPSKVFKQIGVYTGQGMVDGMKKMNSKVAGQAKNMAKAAVPKISKVDYGAQMKNSISKASGRVQASVDHMVSPGQIGTSGGGGVTQNITINSPTPLSPSETARKQKQASQRLAMEWGV